ncbi:MAG: glycoside hydrolase family 5 protein [Kiritimatiellaeota bacterium]|nr:glycoside hydrolase family 5 protein [Kiritimatiellota bacterium]
MINLGKGVNLGGWLSQGPYKDEHRNAFVTRDDFARIANWGFKNLRIPFDLPLICPTPEDRVPCEAGLAWLDRALEWAEECGFRAVLDMHSLPGYTFMDLTYKPDEVPTLFTSEAHQKHFTDLWAALAKRYLGRFPNTVFELANEIAAPTAQQWNDLAAKAVAAIRAVDKTRVIMVGSNCWNVCFTYVDLAKIPDPNIIYNFHFYNPFSFTHQKAPWSPEMLYYNTTVHYPGRSPGLRDAARCAEGEGQSRTAAALLSLADFFEDRVSDKTHLADLMADTFNFARKHSVPVYCGEFGIMDFTPEADSLRWVKDTVEVFAEHNVAWSYWSYKGMGAGIVNIDGSVRLQALLDILRNA